MKIKEKIIKETQARIEKRLVKIKGILDANPLSEICELRIKALEIMIEHKGDYNKIGELIGPMAKEEKRLFALAKKQSKDSMKLIDEQVKLKNELYDLSNELYQINKGWI